MATRNPSAARSTTFALHRDGQELYFVPDCPGIRRRFSTRLIAATTDRRRRCGYRVDRPTIGMLDPSMPALSSNAPCPCYWGPNSGLENAVRVVAAELDYSLDGPRMRPIGSREPSTANRERNDDHLIDFIENHNSGIIAHQPGRVDVSRVCVAVASAFSHARIAFVSDNRDCNRAFHKRLRNYGVYSTLIDAETSVDRPPQIVVSTFYGLAVDNLDVDKFQLIVSLNACEAISERAQMALQGCRRARLFALQPFVQHYSPSQDDRIHATFGFAVATLPEHGRRCRNIDAVFAAAKKPTSRMTWDINHSHRHICTNDRRNRPLAQVARALAEGSIDRLRELCPRLPAWVDRPQRTIIVVANSQQAKTFADRLSDWPILPGAGYLDSLAATDANDCLRGRWCPGFIGPPAIVTLAAFDQLDLDSFDVDAIVWAAAGPHGPTLPPERLTCPGQCDRRLLLVDLQDQFGLPGQWTQQRCAAYRRSFWLGNCSDEARRIVRFLDTRP